jgi:putative tryptophan/tyrosine transport system substrate-binding protein
MTLKKLWCIGFLSIAGMAGVPAGSAGEFGTRHVVIVMEGKNVRLQPQVDGLRHGLEELKYVRGENLDWKQVEGDTREELGINLKALMRRQQVDLVVALGTTETAVAKEVAPSVPIIFLPAADPIKSGFVQSLARPGSNLTGLTFFTDSQSVGKQLEVFKQIVPSLRKVWAVYDGRLRSGGQGESWQRLAAVASWLGIRLIEQPVTSSAEAAHRIVGFANSEKNAGVFVVCSGLFKDLEEPARAAATRKLSLFGCNAFQVAEQNVLASYAPDLYSLGYRGAWFADRIFRGARPMDLPVETPRKFELVINNKVAGEIGIRLAPEMLMLADRVFK